MSIASAITNLQSRVADAYTSIGNKGGTIPQTQDTLHLPAAIASIPAGSSTKWGMSIEDVCYVDNNGVGKFNGGVSGALSFTGVLNISESGFANAFKNCAGITSVSFPDMTSITNDFALQNAFAGCTGLTTVSFTSLTTITGSKGLSLAFDGCTSLTSVSFPALTTINTSTAIGLDSAFRGCTSLTSISFPELTTIQGIAFQSAFSNCTNLTSVTFPKLTNTNYNSIFKTAFNGTSVTTLSFPELTTMTQTGSTATMAPFQGNTTITRMDFPKLTVMSSTNQTGTTSMYLFSGCTALTELHFGEDNQTVIEASSGYATKWGAPSGCTIYFDL